VKLKTRKETTGDTVQNFMMTEKLQRSNYIAAILMEIRRKQTISSAAFREIIINGTILDELINNYDYYHMYDHRTVIEELSEKDRLLKAELQTGG
jgi:hypothetical protein